VQGYGPTSYGDSFADVYDDWYQDLGDPAPCVALVATLLAEAAPGGVVAELGVGTGRLARPLAAAGVPVVGVDASRPMLGRAAAKGPDAGLHLVEADMAVLPLSGGSCAGALVAFNTLFNLTAPGAQAACLAEVRRVLAPGGWLLVETLVVPEAERPVQGVDVGRIELDRLVLTASRLDPEARTISGQHVEITEAGIRLRPWHLRYLTVDELDAAAAAAGFDLVERWAGWDGSAFTADDERQVSRYRRR
jgi:ubiquinone/menaquinone biosynthesis C-methylase UbiE